MHYLSFVSARDAEQQTAMKVAGLLCDGVWRGERDGTGVVTGTRWVGEGSEANGSGVREVCIIFLFIYCQE